MAESVLAKLLDGKAVGDKYVDMAEVELWTRGTKRKAFEQERSNTAKMYRQTAVEALPVQSRWSLPECSLEDYYC